MLPSLGGGLKIACVFIGAVVGAGFASGREIATFFEPLGLHARWAQLAAALAMSVGAYTTVRLAGRNRLPNYGAVFKASAGAQLGTVLDLLATLMLYMTASVTLAGGAALLETHYALPSPLALLVIAGLSVTITLRGFKVLAKASSWLVPILMAAMVLVLAAGVICLPVSPPLPDGPALASAQGMLSWSQQEPARPPSALTLGSVISAGLLYGAFNLVLAAGILAAGAGASTTGEAALGGAVGGLVLGGMACAVLEVCRRAGPEVLGAPVPLAALAARIGPPGLHLYAVIFLIAVLTTVGAAATSLAERIRPSRPGRGYAAVPLVIILALVPARAGFVRLVQLVYPPLGLLGLIWLWSMLCWPAGQEPHSPRPTL